MNIHPYEFTAPIVSHHMGRDLFYTVVFLPADLIPALPLDETPRLRIEAECRGVTFDGALMPVRGDFYLMISRKLMKRLGAEIGDEIEVRFGIADQDAVRMPPELSDALDAHPDLREVWEGWTAGKRRGWAHRVTSAKAAATKARRVEEVLAALAD